MLHIIIRTQDHDRGLSADGVAVYEANGTIYCNIRDQGDDEAEATVAAAAIVQFFYNRYEARA